MGSQWSRVLVAGGAGFIGSHVCTELVNSGVEVICVDNLSTSLFSNVEHLSENPLFSFVLQDAGANLWISGGIDAIFHLASPASPKDYKRLSIETLKAGSQVTFNLLSLAQKKEARFLLASTSEVYGDPLQHPQSEVHWGNVNPVGPRSAYDEAKRFAEAVTVAYQRAEGVDTTIVRVFNTYGPKMRPGDGRMIPNFISQALAGDPVTIYGDGRQTRSFCYISDLVRGIIAAAASTHTGPINLGNPDERTVLSLAERVVDLCASTSPIVFAEPVAEDPSRRCPDISEAWTRLGWRPRVSVDEGLATAIGWFRSQLSQRIVLSADTPLRVA